MPKEEGELLLMRRGMADLVKGGREKFSTYAGVPAEEVSPEKQMAAYIQYKDMSFNEQAQVRMAMDTKHGPGKSVRWEKEMESRYQRSMRQRVLPFEEVLK